MVSNIKNDEKMDLQRAFNELEISLDEIELTNLNQEYIKKKYHKALRLASVGLFFMP